MKPETLTALLMDRELGELSPESVELLDAYLALSPAAQSEAKAVARTVSTARETIHAFPGLTPVAEGKALSFPTIFKPWLARAAALIAFSGTCAVLGYRAGTSASHPDGSRNGGVVARAEPNRHFDGPWTQYRVAYDDQRKTFAVQKCP